MMQYNVIVCRVYTEKSIRHLRVQKNQVVRICFGKNKYRVQRL